MKPTPEQVEEIKAIHERIVFESNNGGPLKRVVRPHGFIAPRGYAEPDGEYRSRFNFVWWFWLPRIHTQRPDVQNPRVIRIIWLCFAAGLDIWGDESRKVWPETDAVWDKKENILDHARKLERERDEARTFQSIGSATGVPDAHRGTVKLLCKICGQSWDEAHTNNGDNCPNANPPNDKLSHTAPTTT